MTDNELVAPRPLTSSDTGHLRTIFELQLHITNQEDEDDAADLINYALDMVGRGKNVGSVIEEVSASLSQVLIVINISPCRRLILFIHCDTPFYFPYPHQFSNNHGS